MQASLVLKKSSITNTTTSTHFMRKSWSYNPIFDIEGEDSIPIGAFAWPPKSYSCRFCKREFRSAQALGGHMNVHRRDRARLRHLPLWNLPTLEDPQTNTNPNPNPNHVSYVPRNHDSCPHLFPSNTCKSLMPKSMKSLLCVEEMEVVVRHGHHLSRREDVRVDMEVGSRGDVLEDDVDLELRLGYG